MKGGLDRLVKQIEIGLLLEWKLTQYRAPSLPEIVAFGPREDGAPHGLGFVSQNEREIVGGDRVDVIPPSAGDDQLLERSERRHRVKGPPLSALRQLDGRV